MSDQQLLKDPRFDLTDFHRRWSRARRAALATVLGADRISDDESESVLVACVKSEDHESLLRAVFDQSRRLGLSLSSNLQLVLEIGDFEDLFRTSGIHCFAGDWIRRPEVRILRRSGCDPLVRSTIVCSYWREAADGLVMGGGGDERFVRHRNVAFGDPECEDVLFLEVPSVTSPKLGPIPERFDPELVQIQTLFRAIYRMELQFPGYADGVLYYQFKSDSAAACGPGARLLEQVLLRKLEALHSGLRVRDASPRTILGGPE